MWPRTSPTVTSQRDLGCGAAGLELPRHDQRGTPAREQRRDDPAGGAFGVADLAPGAVFLDDLDRQAGTAELPLCRVLGAGAGAHVHFVGLQADESRHGQAAAGRQGRGGLLGL